MTQDPKINPATGYVHDDSQLVEKPQEAVIDEPIQADEVEEKQEASE
jgi:hypothetical protein